MSKTPPENPPFSIQSRGSWFFILLTLAVTFIAIAFIASNQRYQASQIEAELQSLQLKLMERSLASESLINDETVARLQRAETGESLSAIAHLSGKLPHGEVVTAPALWSDASQAGHLILPEPLVAQVLSARIEITATIEGSSAEYELMVSQADHPRILGFRLIESVGQVSALRLKFQSLETDALPVVLQGALVR